MITAIFDRSQEDVDRVRELTEKYLAGLLTEEERPEWLGSLKGALNASDLNRVEGNCATVAEEIAVVADVKSWGESDIPRVSDYQRILSNVKKIREGYALMHDTPETPVPPLNDFQKWNDIERILYDVDYIYSRVEAGYNYCGTELYAGEGTGII